MFDNFREGYREELASIRDAGTYKEERVISSPQSAAIEVPQGEVINFCANNYLGLSSHPAILAGAHKDLWPANDNCNNVGITFVADAPQDAWFLLWYERKSESFPRRVDANADPMCAPSSFNYKSGSIGSGPTVYAGEMAEAVWTNRTSATATMAAN